MEKSARERNTRYFKSEFSSSESSDKGSPSEIFNASMAINKSVIGSREFSRFKDHAELALQKGNIHDALAKYHLSFETMGKLTGLHSSEFIIYFTNTIEELNTSAMNHIKNSDFETAFEVLAWCEKMVSPKVYGSFPMLVNITFNNIGCTYRRVGQLQCALDYLDAALDVLVRTNNQQYSSKTYLNLCAVLSQLGNHDKAAEHAKSALIYAQDELLRFKEIGAPFDMIREKVSLLSIAYHNIGVEEEYRGNLENALNWYEKSVKVLKENDISNEMLLQKFVLAYEAAKKKYIKNELHRPRLLNSLNESVRLTGRSLSGNRSRNLSPSNEFKLIPTEQEQNIKQESMTSAKKPRLTNNFTRPSRERAAQFYLQNNRTVEKTTTSGLDQSWDFQARKPKRAHHELTKLSRPQRVSSAKNPAIRKQTFSRESYERETEEQLRLINQNFDTENLFKLSFREAQKRELHKSSDWKNSNRNERSTHPDSFPLGKEMGLSSKLTGFLDGTMHLNHSYELNRTNWRDISYEKTRRTEGSPKDKKEVKKPDYFETSTDNEVIREIKALKKAGVLDGSDSDHENNSDADELKENRLKFLASLSYQKNREPALNKSLNFDLLRESRTKENVKKQKKIDKKQKNWSIGSTNPSDPSLVKKRKTPEDEADEEEQVGTSQSNLSHYSVQNSPNRPATLEEWSNRKKKLEESAVKIQAYYKGLLAREMCLLLQEQRTKYKNKKLVLKDHHRILTKLNENDPSPSTKIYNVKIYFDSKNIQFYVYLIELLKRHIYDAFADIPEALMKQQAELKESSFIRELKNYAETLLNAIQVEGHVIVFNNLKIGRPKKLEPPDNGKVDKKDNEKELIRRPSAARNNEPRRTSQISGARKRDSEDTEYEDFISKNKHKVNLINVSQRDTATTKIAAVMRGHLMRQRYKVIKGRKTQILLTLTEKYEGRTIQIKVIRILNPDAHKGQQKGNISVSAYDFTHRINYKMLLIPQNLIRNMTNWKDAFSLIDFDMTHCEVHLKEKYCARLSPAGKASLRDYNEKQIIDIQKHMRRFLAQQHYELMREHHHKMNGFELKRRWFLLFDDCVFKMILLYNHKEETFKIIANSKDYYYKVNEQACTLLALTRGSKSAIVNSQSLRQIAKIIADHTFLIKEAYLLKISLKLHQARLQVAQLFKSPNHNQTSGDDNEKEKASQRRRMRFELAERVYEFRPFSQQQMFAKSAVAVLTKSELFFTVPDLTSITQEREKAVIFIQRSYRRHVRQRNLKAMAKIGSTLAFKESKSFLILNGLRVKSASRGPHHSATRRDSGISKGGSSAGSHLNSKQNQLPEASRAKQPSTFRSNKEILYQGTLKFDNTIRTCNIEVTYHKADMTSKTDYILINITFHVTGAQQAIRIPIADLPDFNKKEFEKRIEELLIHRLEFSRSENKVVLGSGKGVRKNSAESTIVQKSNPKEPMTKVEQKALKPELRKYEKAAILIQKVAKARLARHKFEIMKLSTKRKFRILRKGIKKVGSLYFQIEFLLIQAEKVLEIQVKHVDDANMKAKVRLPIKKLELIELLNSSLHIDDGILKARFAESLAKLESMLVIKQQGNTIKVLFEEAKKQAVKSSVKTSMLPKEREGLGGRTISVEKKSMLTIKQDQLGLQLRLAGNSQAKSKEVMITPEGTIDSEASKHESSLKMTKDSKENETIELPKHSENSITIEKEKDSKFQLKPKSKDAQEDRLQALLDKKTTHGNKKQRKESLKERTYKERLNDAAILIQKNYRAAKEREKTKLRIQAKLAGKGYFGLYKRVASLVYRSQNNPWIVFVSVHQKFPERLNFVASEADPEGSSQRKVAKGAYIIPRSQLINTDGTSFYQYLAGRMVIVNGEVTIRDFERPEILTRVEEPSETSTVSTPGTQRTTTSQREQAEDIIVDRYTLVQDDTNKIVYNVVYNLKEFRQKPSVSKQAGKISELSKQQAPQNPQNTVRVDIEYNDLKRFAPHLDLNSADDLRKTAAELSRSIYLSEEGGLLINSSKLNPKIVKLTENSASIKKNGENAIKNLNQITKKSYHDVHGRKQMLHKVSKVSGGNKYLFVAICIEKIFQDFESKKQNDNIFEEYELYMEISAFNLSQPNKPKITWELSFGEARKLNMDDPKAIARTMLASIDTFDDKFLLPIPHKIVTNYEKAIIISEYSLRRIQKRIRYRKYRIGHANFIETTKKLGSNTIFKTVLKFNGISLITIFVDNSKSVLDVIAWETGLFHQTRIQIDKKFIQKIYEKDRLSACELILQNLGIEQDERDEFHFVFHEVVGQEGKGLKEDLVSKRTPNSLYDETILRRKTLK